MRGLLEIPAFGAIALGAHLALFAGWSAGAPDGAGDGGDASVVHENPVLGVTRGNGKARGNGRGERTSVSNPLAGGAGAGTGWGDEYDLFLAGGGKRD